MKRIFLIVALMAMGACSKETTPTMDGNMAIQIDPTITRATEVDFESGDRIGLSILTADGDQLALNAPFTFSGSAFLSDEGLLWYEDLGLESTLTAYYPYAEDTATALPATFTIQADQTAEGYNASDLMMAQKAGVKPTVQATHMTFYHKLTKIVINLTNDYGLNVEGVTLHNVASTGAINATELLVAATEESEIVSLKAQEVTADKKYAAILIPQSVALKVDVTVNNNGTTEVHTQRLAEATLQGGGQYSMDITLLPDEVAVTLSGDIADWEDMGSLTAGEVPFEEYEEYFVYDGESYSIQKMADGNVWMTENLRFIPDGKSPSSDPNDGSGVWYPATNAEKVADPTLVATKGLLYDTATALGVKSITDENATTLAGTQGICPTGWHIPTVEELTGLVGHCSNSSLINTEAPYYDAEVKGASIAALNEAGFNWTFVGVVNRTSTTAKGSYLVTSLDEEDGTTTYGTTSYLLGSTHYTTKRDATTNEITNVQFYSIMSTYNASNKKLSVAYGNFLTGQSVRCIKDQATE